MLQANRSFFDICEQLGGMGGAINAFIGWETCTGGSAQRRIEAETHFMFLNGRFLVKNLQSADKTPFH